MLSEFNLLFSILELQLVFVLMMIKCTFTNLNVPDFISWIWNKIIIYDVYDARTRQRLFTQFYSKIITLKIDNVMVRIKIYYYKIIDYVLILKIYLSKYCNLVIITWLVKEDEEKYKGNSNYNNGNVIIKVI